MLAVSLYAVCCVITCVKEATKERKCLKRLRNTLPINLYFSTFHIHVQKGEMLYPYDARYTNNLGMVAFCSQTEYFFISLIAYTEIILKFMYANEVYTIKG